MLLSVFSYKILPFIVNLLLLIKALLSNVMLPLTINSLVMFILLDVDEDIRLPLIIVYEVVDGSPAVNVPLFVR